MKISSLLNHSAQLLEAILSSSNPADKVSNHFLRRKKYIGSKDRKFISETVFCSLRHLLILNSILNYIIDHKNIKISAKQESFLRVLILAALSCEFQNQIEWLKTEAVQNTAKFSGAALPRGKNDTIVLFSEIIAENKIEIDPVFLYETAGEYFIKLESALKNLKYENISDTHFEIIEKRYSFPLFLLKKITKRNPFIKTAEIAESMLHDAPVCLRTAVTEISRDKIASRLLQEGIEACPGRLSPVSIILRRRANILQTELFRSGFIEVQDEGSQLISYALSPGEKSTVLDACAGAGGKTLHIASIQNDKGKITASDIDLRKLKELNSRAKRFGYTSIKTVLSSPSADKTPKNNKHFQKNYEYVLIDAPCSGSGTFRRNPKQKYFITDSLIKKLNENQLRILNYYSELTAPGGILVYATCSLLPDENEEIIEKFLIANPDFQPDNILPVFEGNKIKIAGLKEGDFYLTLNPAEHKTDGFFMCRMKRRF